jgi:hypothetical protein
VSGYPGRDRRAGPTSVGQVSEPATTYLVEAYVAGLDAASTRLIDLRLQAAVEDLRSAGSTMMWLGSLAAPAEETYSYVVLCASRDEVAQVSAAAALRADHVSEVLLGSAPRDGGRLGR